VRAAATGKARSPTVDSRVRRTVGDDEEVERSRLWASESAEHWSSIIGEVRLHPDCSLGLMQKYAKWLNTVWGSFSVRGLRPKPVLGYVTFEGLKAVIFNFEVAYYKL